MMLRRIAICLLPLSLSGCLMLAMKGMEGMDSCPPQAIQQANQNYAILSQLQPNMSLKDYPELARAEKSETMTLMNGYKLQAFFFRTGHQRCRYMPTDTEYTPVLVGMEGTIKGIGSAAYFRARQHTLSTQRHSYLPPKEHSLADLLI